MESTPAFPRRVLGVQLPVGLARLLPWASISILVVMYAVGLVGLHSSEREWFLAATPLTLVLSSGLLLLNHRGWRLRFAACVALVAVAGYLVEVVGVRTGLIFGEYAYGNVLGIKVLDTPLVIGLNWLLLVYATGDLVSGLRLPVMVRAIMAAAAMTALDVLIEPVAMRLGFWDWESGVVPLQNYVAWFGIGLVMQLLFVWVRGDREARSSNLLSGAVLALQVIFFGILNLNI